MSEPVVSAASISGIISAGLMWFCLMGWINWTDDQFNSFMIFANLVIPVVAALWARSKVTPVADPKDVDGISLSRPGDQLPIKQLESLQAEALKMNERRTEI